MNPQYAARELFGTLLVAGLIAVAVVTLIGAVFLRVAAKLVEKLDIPFEAALVSMLIVNLIGCAMGFTVGAADRIWGLRQGGTVPPELALIPLGFALQSLVISLRHKLTYLKGLRITLYMFLVALVIGTAVAAVVVPILYGTGVLHG